MVARQQAALIIVNSTFKRSNHTRGAPGLGGEWPQSDGP
jgi:hypothetical protein